MAKHPWPAKRAHDPAQRGCKACAFLCIDHRFRKSYDTFLEGLGLLGEGGADTPSLAGVAKNFARPDTPEEKFAAFAQLKKSRKLHDPKIVLLLQHEDCGAYGGGTDLKKHKDDTEVAARMILEYDPEIQRVEGWLIQKDGRGVPLGTWGR